MSDIQTVYEHIDEDEIVDLAGELVGIRSATGDEGELAEFIVDWLDRQGIKSDTQVIEDGRYNAVGKLVGANEGDGTSLMFNGHMDTSQTGRDEDYLVYAEQSRHRDWEAEMYEEDGRLFGAGVMNDKGPIAAFLIAAKAIDESDVTLDGDLLLAAVAGEIGKAPVDEYQGRRYRGHGVGTRHLLNHGFVSDYAIVAENSKWGVSWGLPGAIYLKLTLHGRQSYISNIDYETASEGNSIYRSLAVADAIREWGQEYTEENTVEYAGGRIEPKVNVGAMRAGLPPKPNYQPELAKLYVDVRVPPNRSPEDVRKEVAGVVRDIDDTIEIDVYRSQRGFIPTGEEIDYLVETVEDSYRSVFGEDPPKPTTKQNSKWNDVNVYNEHGIPAVKIAPGPGPMTSQHLRRSVTPEELTQAAKLYAESTLSICGTVD